MADIGVFGNHKFQIKPKLIKSFRDMNIKGECETEDNTSGSQQYVSRKNGKPTEITLTIDLNALTGVKDVYGEAMQWLLEADNGVTSYFYLGPSKILNTQFMLTKAEVTEIVHRPGYGNQWISCSVKLTLKKAAASDSGSGSSGGSGSGSSGYTAKVYYQLGSGASCYSVTAWSSVSYADALKKAKAKVPSGATWVGTNPSSAPTPSQPSSSTPGTQTRARAASSSYTPSTGLAGRANRQTRSGESTQ